MSRNEGGRGDEVQLCSIDHLQETCFDKYSLNLFNSGKDTKLVLSPFSRFSNFLSVLFWVSQPGMVNQKISPYSRQNDQSWGDNVMHKIQEGFGKLVLVRGFHNS